MAIGIVKWFNPEKGYGFISPEDGSNDVFLHISELEKSGVNRVDENQRVSYDVQPNRGKSAAVDIQLQN